MEEGESWWDETTYDQDRRHPQVILEPFVRRYRVSGTGPIDWQRHIHVVGIGGEFEDEKFDLP